MKKAKLTKIFACAFICVAVFFSLPCLAADPVDEEKYIIESFDYEVGDFDAGENVKNVALQKLSTDIDGTVDTRSCLEVVGSYSDIGVLRSTVASFSEAIDLTEYRKVAYDIYVPIYEADPEAVYYTRLTLFSSDGSSTENLVSVESGQWCHIEADIGTWDSRGDIVSAEIAYVVDTVHTGYMWSGFYVDDIYAYDKVDRELAARFLFDKFESDGANAALSRDNTMLTLVSESFDSFSLSASVFMPETQYDVNCLRIKLANNTPSDTLTLHYTTFDTQANSEDKTVSIPIVPMSKADYYYAYVGDASMLRSIELIFDEGGGSVEIYSLSAISSYKADEYDVCGSVNICRLNDDLTSVNFYGEINREVALDHQDSRIAIYTYEADTLPTEDELAALEPIVTGDMTTRFELNWQMPADNPYACYSRYLAAVVHSDGSYTLIAPPFYIDNPGRRADDGKGFTSDVKGFAADDISLIGETDSGITQLTLDTRRAFTSKDAGEQFIYNGCVYYLNSEYLGQLSKQISVLHGSGVSVLLRYSGWDRAYKDELMLADSTNITANYINNTNASAGSDFIGALSAYTAKTWCADGSVVGVIFGEGENIIPVGETSVSEMIAYTARELCKIYFNLSSANSEAKVYISVTDLYDTDPATNVRELPLNEYLPAFISEAAQYGNYGWEIAVEVIERDKSFEADRITVNDCARLTELLYELGCSEKHLIFCDGTYAGSTERLSALIKQYVVGYYSAYFNDSIDAYIAIAGEKAASISETVRYIDTTEASVISATALLTLRIDSLADIIDGYDESKLPRRRLSYAEALYEAPTGIKGAYNYFVFDSASNLGSVEAGYYCGDMQIVRDGTTAMSVQLDSKLYGGEVSGNWLGIMHRFEYTENLEHTPIIAVTMRIENTVPAVVSEVPVKLVLRSENERFESIGELITSDWVTLYFDIGEFGGIEDTEMLQLLVGDGELESATLLIKDIKGLSREYNDESLESVIAEERLKKRTPDEDSGYSAYIWVGGAVLVVAATIIIVALLSRKKGDARE
ncbi:MAG: hypothetical protein IJ428_01670 [Clostridia bacterium]|nr:hypothetical protein [Clostridia bacterium]